MSCPPAHLAHAQDALREVPDPDPQRELEMLRVPEGYEINLFAAEPMIAKPIQMNWDEQGRLWVASSTAYPQVVPGQIPNDKIIVLEDTDGDGQADQSTVFADSLLTPTGLMPGDGGVYVANSTEILHLEDTDGDGRADQRRTVLRGFGQDDTHHLIHTFRWGPEARLYLNQAITSTAASRRRGGCGGSMAAASGGSGRKRLSWTSSRAASTTPGDTSLTAGGSPS